MAIKLENSPRLDIVLRKISLDEMDEIIERMTEFRERVEKAAEAEENLAKSVLAASKELEDTLNVRVVLKRNKYTRAPKYQYKDHDGSFKTWAGVGKIPKALKEKITVNGHVDRDLLTDFLIVKDDNAVYQFKDEKGFVKTWSGKGKTPKALQLLLDKGYNLENFKIKAH